MSTGVVVLMVAVVAAVAFGSWRALTDGRFRGTHAVRREAPAGRAASPGEAPAGRAASPGERVETRVETTSASVLADTGWATQLGERATLLQFSSAFCAPCRVTRRTLAEVARIVPGVTHIEVDAELHLELVRRVGILRTPTTIVLDAAGREVSRATGAPTKQSVIAGLAWIGGCLG
ncbi:MAG: TlpA family protein disulfide reductase [Marmoricola sp.]